MIRNLIAVFFLSILSIGFEPHGAKASTTVEYKSPCKYFNASGTLQSSTICKVNFGTIGVSGPTRYVVTFPHGSRIVVFVYFNGEVETNGIVSDIATAGGNVLIATDEGEIFIFSTPAV